MDRERPAADRQRKPTNKTTLNIIPRDEKRSESFRRDVCFQRASDGAATDRHAPNIFSCAVTVALTVTGAVGCWHGGRCVTTTARRDRMAHRAGSDEIRRDSTRLDNTGDCAGWGGEGIRTE